MEHIITAEKGGVDVVDHLEFSEATGHLANQIDHEETVKQALSRHPWTLFWCVYAIWILCISSFDNQAGGVVLGIPEFRKDFGSEFDGNYVLDAGWQAAFSGGPVATAVIGSLGAAYIADKIGRKLMYLVTFAFVFAGITCETVATTNPVFFAGKLLNGFAVGSFIAVSVAYIGEITPLALRGIMTAAAAGSFTIGSLVAAVIVNSTGALDNRWAYRGIFVAQYAISAIGFFLLPFMPESPTWLLSRGKNEKAVRSLRGLGQSPVQIERSIAYITLTLERAKQETKGASYLECFRNSNLRRTMIAIMPLTIQALGGVYFIAAYSTYYFQLAGYSAADSFKLGIAAQVLAMLGNISSWFIIDRVGRRALTFWGVFALTVLLMVIGGLAVAGGDGAIKGTVGLILFYNYLYNITIGATAYVALAEIATTRLRIKTASIGLALQNALSTMWGFVIPYIFNPDQANLGAKTAFIFGGLSVLCTVYVWFCHPETRGRSYEELDEMFIKKVPPRSFGTFATESEAVGKEVATNIHSTVGIAD